MLCNSKWGLTRNRSSVSAENKNKIDGILGRLKLMLSSLKTKQYIVDDVFPATIENCRIWTTIDMLIAIRV